MMRKLRVSYFFIGVIFAAVMGAPSQAADEPANLIKYRQATMGTIGGHMQMLVAPLSGEVSFTDEIVVHALAINQLSKNLARLFPEGSGQEAGDTRALPTIWKKWDEFEAARKRLEDESAKLAEIAESGDMAATGAQLGVLGKEACGGCHKKFRKEKK